MDGIILVKFAAAYVTLCDVYAPKYPIWSKFEPNRTKSNPSRERQRLMLMLLFLSSGEKVSSTRLFCLSYQFTIANPLSAGLGLGLGLTLGHTREG